MFCALENIDSGLRGCFLFIFFFKQDRLFSRDEVNRAYLLYKVKAADDFVLTYDLMILKNVELLYRFIIDAIWESDA